MVVVAALMLFYYVICYVKNSVFISLFVSFILSFDQGPKLLLVCAKINNAFLDLFDV